MMSRPPPPPPPPPPRRYAIDPFRGTPPCCTRRADEFCELFGLFLPPWSKHDPYLARLGSWADVFFFFHDSPWFGVPLPDLMRCELLADHSLYGVPVFFTFGAYM